MKNAATCFVLLTLLGCADDSTSARDSSLDSATETGTDTEADTSTDTEADTGTDAEADTGTDAEADTSTDAEADTSTDTEADTGTDAEADTGTDTGGTSGTLIGTEGGIVTGPDGITLNIPADALTETVEIALTAADGDFPIGVAPDSALWHFSPTGLRFEAPVTIAFPSDAPMAQVFWTDVDTDTFHALASTWADGVVSASVDHFSLGFAGWARSSGFCQASSVPNDCTVTVEGAANAACDIDIIGEDGLTVIGTTPGYCYNYFDELGTVVGASCRYSACDTNEYGTACNDSIDNDCDGVVDTLDTDDCTECLSSAACGAGSVCDGGYCLSCSGTGSCSQPNGVADASCSYSPDEGVTTEWGLCMHTVDATGTTCSTSCRFDTDCATDETCGDDIDNDCDGVVDDGCPAACSVDAGCVVGEICDGGYCKSCPGPDIADDCSTSSIDGQPDADCQYLDATETLVGGAVCHHITDSAATVCGTACTFSPTCDAYEQCGNHIDDDCDGVQDNGCTPCNLDSDCASGERCQ